jgi:hypothetical protein
MLSEDMRSNVVFSANHEQGEDARVSVVEMIEIDEGISHYGWVLSVIKDARIENRAAILPKMCIAK